MARKSKFSEAEIIGGIETSRAARPHRGVGEDGRKPADDASVAREVRRNDRIRGAGEAVQPRNDGQVSGLSKDTP